MPSEAQQSALRLEAMIREGGGWHAHWSEVPPSSQGLKVSIVWAKHVRWSKGGPGSGTVGLSLYKFACRKRNTCPISFFSILLPLKVSQCGVSVWKQGMHIHAKSINRNHDLPSDTRVPPTHSPLADCAHNHAPIWPCARAGWKITARLRTGVSSE